MQVMSYDWSGVRTRRVRYAKIVVTALAALLLARLFRG